MGMGRLMPACASGPAAPTPSGRVRFAGLYYGAMYGTSATSILLNSPAVIGHILGPMAEVQFRWVLTISQGDGSVFFTHPISLVLLVIALAVVVVPIIVRRMMQPAAV